MLVLFNHCSKTDKKNSKKAIINKTESNETKKDSLINFKVLKEKDEKILLLNDKNAIPFFFNYQNLLKKKLFN